MRILGIDPGTNRIGYGFIESQGQKLKLICSGIIKISEKENQKFLILGEKFDELIKRLKPDLAAIEKLYFSKNQKTAIEVAQARGILLFLLIKSKIPVIECAPSEIKGQITGYGLSDKIAVAKMVNKILKINLNVIDDITDAIAVAISASRKTLDNN